jgi:hypothetical protein
MTPGQMQQLQDLNRCYMPHGTSSWVRDQIEYAEFVSDYRFNKRQKAILRRLTHQYRNQIAAIRRNQGVR